MKQVRLIDVDVGLNYMMENFWFEEDGQKHVGRQGDYILKSDECVIIVSKEEMENARKSYVNRAAYDKYQLGESGSFKDSDIQPPQDRENFSTDTVT